MGGKLLAAVLSAQPHVAGPLRVDFPDARQALAGWMWLKPGMSRPPEPYTTIARTLAQGLVDGGLPLEVLCLWVTLQTYLRTADLAKVRAGETVAGQPAGGMSYTPMEIGHFIGQ